MQLIGNWEETDDLTGAKIMLGIPSDGIVPVGTKLLWSRYDYTHDRDVDTAMVAMDETARVGHGFIKIPESDFVVGEGR